LKPKQQLPEPTKKRKQLSHFLRETTSKAILIHRGTHFKVNPRRPPGSPFTSDILPDWVLKSFGPFAFPNPDIQGFLGRNKWRNNLYVSNVSNTNGL
jgi:hypothetical protein